MTDHEALSPARIMSIVDKLERAVRASGAKSCGLSLTQHDWLIGQAQAARRSLAAMIAPNDDFDTLGQAAKRVVAGARERMLKP